MNNILLEIFPEAVNNLIVRFNIHPVAEAFKRGIKTMKICHEDIQDIKNNQCSFSHAYFQNYSDMKQLEYDRMTHYGELSYD